MQQLLAEEQIETCIIETDLCTMGKWYRIHTQNTCFKVKEYITPLKWKMKPQDCFNRYRKNT
jgi:hypothetical protein